MKVVVYVDESADSDEAIGLISSVGLMPRRIPANGHSVPTLVYGNQEYSGLKAIRLFLNLYKKSSVRSDSNR